MNSRIRELSSLFSYHVTLRVHGSGMLFRDTEDFNKFLRSLQKAANSYNMKIVAYALMGNHIHLILQGNLKLMSRVFQSMGASFAKWYNKKYGKKGAVYDQRFHSVPINSKEQFIETLTYVYNNPVTANIVKDAADYEWSSFRSIANGEASITDVDAVSEVCDLEFLCRLTRKKAAHDWEWTDSAYEGRPKDAEVKDFIVREVGKHQKGFLKSKGNDFLRLIFEKLLDLGATLSQMERATGISRYRIQKILS